MFELEILVELKALLGDVPIFRDEQGECIWTGDSYNLYTAMAGVNLALKNENNAQSPSVAAWSRVAPPRVQDFVWCELRRNILSKAELNRWGILTPNHGC